MNNILFLNQSKNDCGVCSNNSKHSQSKKYLTLRCGHIFHQKCMQSNSCPNCNEKSLNSLSAKQLLLNTLKDGFIIVKVSTTILGMIFIPIKISIELNILINQLLKKRINKSLISQKLRQMGLPFTFLISSTSVTIGALLILYLLFKKKENDV